jgi:hypothetical protein
MQDYHVNRAILGIEGKSNLYQNHGRGADLCGMVHTSRLIYKDSVTKLNREIRFFLVFMIAGMMGSRRRDYMEEQAGKEDVPSKK